MLTLSMIVKNEEKYLKDCLLSVKNVVDEIVIVDTGSTDNTLKIAESFNAKIYHFDWIKDFSAARNFGLGKSNGDWILYLDADERLDPLSIDRIRKITKKNGNAAYNCTVKSIDEINNRPSLMKYPRLFPKGKGIKFEGAVHEQIELSLTKNNYKILDSDILINHLGYSISKEDLREKAKRNLEILLYEFSKNKSAYIAYQLGQTYGMLDEKTNAIEYFKLALLDSKLNNEYKSQSLRYIAAYNLEISNLADAQKYIINSLEADEKQPLSFIIAAQIMMKINKNDEAATFCEKAYFVNSQLISQKDYNKQTIFLPENVILYYCLNISIHLKDVRLFNKYFNLFKLNIKTNSDELLLYKALLNNENISNDLNDKINLLITETNLDLFISLIEKYTITQSKINLLKKLLQKIKNDSLYSQLGSAYLEVGELEKASELYKKALNINFFNFSAFFYLLSTLLKLGDLSTTIKFIEIAKIEYAGNPVLDQILAIEGKLALITNPGK